MCSASSLQAPVQGEATGQFGGVGFKSGVLSMLAPLEAGGPQYEVRRSLMQPARADGIPPNCDGCPPVALRVPAGAIAGAIQSSAAADCRLNPRP
jgi:hypothetical protein